MIRLLTIIVLVAMQLAPATLSATEHDAPPAFPAIIGELRTVKVHEGETLMEIARREGVGFELLANSNRQHDAWNPRPGTEVVLPLQAIVPAGAKPGIVINLAEMRLFHIIDRDDGWSIVVYPLGIGREGRETPEGEYRIITKKEKPDWRVPAGLRSADPSLPQIVPPGPGNPLGDYWLGLSAQGYGIHGTNRPFGVGRRVSYGCLRMYPADIASLYRKVAPGTPVTVSYQPIKAAWQGKHLFLEVHPDYRQQPGDPFQKALTVISRTGWPGEIDYARVRDVVAGQTSTPEIVGVWLVN